MNEHSLHFLEDFSRSKSLKHAAGISTSLASQSSISLGMLEEDAGRKVAGSKTTLTSKQKPRISTIYVKSNA